MPKQKAFFNGIILLVVVMDFETNFIENNESKKMFEEILVNFYHHNYRSCIVSLNTLLYYDLMKKIEILNDNYKDI